MATEADLIQKFKDLDIPVGADFEELIHAAFASSNLADQINSKADDSKVVHTADMRKPASDVAGIDEVNTKQDKIGYTPADDSKVVHNTGTEEIAGQKTFDVAPIDKTTGNLYITKDGVPAVPSTLADTTKLSNFTAGLQSNGTPVATTSDVTTAISTATANMVDSSKPTNFTARLQSGGVDVATAADLKSVEDSAWRPIISNNYSGLCMMKYNTDTETMSLSGTIFPKTYSNESSRYAVIIPLPDGFSMGTNADSKTTIWTNDHENVQYFAGKVADLKYESDGVHIIFDSIYTTYSDPQMFIILDDFFASSTANPQSINLINFKVTKN